MYKYSFLINGDPYYGLFKDGHEADEFIRENEEDDGATVKIENVEFRHPLALLDDPDLEYWQCVEAMGEALLPNIRNLHYYVQVEKELKNLGFIK